VDEQKQTRHTKQKKNKTEGNKPLKRTNKQARTQTNKHT
jgi:hypothetical protein